MKDINKIVEQKEVSVRTDSIYWGALIQAHLFPCKVTSKAQVPVDSAKKGDLGVLGMEGHYAECYPG